MRRLAIINQKGGVGKTTTTANLGAALSRAGLRVLLVDLDPQAHLTLYFGVEVGDGQFSVYDDLTADAPVAQAVLELRDGMVLLPASIDLAGAEAELISVTGREMILRDSLARWGREFDVMLIDCPPALGVLTINALVAADEVLIPLQAHFFALQGLGKLLDTVSLVRKRIHPRLVVNGIVLCLHESATKLASEVVADIQRFLASSKDSHAAWNQARLYQSCIRRNIKLAESASYGQTVFEYALRSNGALDYAHLAAEVFEVSSERILMQPEDKVDPEAASRPGGSRLSKENAALERMEIGQVSAEAVSLEPSPTLMPTPAPIVGIR
ncbi:MAG: ParA family protein [Planctomycetota bacterium]